MANPQMANWLMYGESAYGKLTMAKCHVAKRRIPKKVNDVDSANFFFAAHGPVGCNT